MLALRTFSSCVEAPDQRNGQEAERHRRGCEDEGATVEPQSRSIWVPSRASTTPSGRRLTGGRCPLHARSSGAQQKRARQQDRVRRRATSLVHEGGNPAKARGGRRARRRQRAVLRRSASIQSESIQRSSPPAQPPTRPRGAPAHRPVWATLVPWPSPNACELEPMFGGFGHHEAVISTLQVGRITPPWLSGIAPHW